jgi:putative photosynthetic complex assembly protein 2
MRADTPPSNNPASPSVKVVIITLDNHLSGAVQRARARFAVEQPGVSIAFHAAADWEDSAKLDAARGDIATGDIILTSMIFLEDQIRAIKPALEARRDDCDAMIGIMSASEIVKLTRMGDYRMDAPPKGPLGWLKKLRGSSKTGAPSSGAAQMAVLRRLPKLLKFVPGTAQDVRAYFLTLQYWLAGSDDNAFSMVRALVLWGWHELSFLMGFVTGPNRDPCPADATGWRRFRLAAATLIHHEVAMFLTVAIIAAASWGQPNQTATLTFMLLFVMRLSAKFNIFAGVPHLSTEMMPDHMRYLASYFRIRPPRLFFAVSLAGISALAAWLGNAALDAEGGVATGYALAFALVILAFVEHGFLVVPWKDSSLFRWAMRNRSITTKAEPVTHHQSNSLAALEAAGQ